MLGSSATNEHIRAEIDRINAQGYGFSSDEVCLLAAVNLCVPFDRVREVETSQPEDIPA
tara:strand:+ start:4888 stop:5064 length:177 start_codon:yes stop_codon:yes gene_type:complete